MPKIAPSALGGHLSRRAPSAAFFVHGDEEYLREEALAAIVDAYLAPATRDFNLDQLRGGEVAAEALASLLATPPMMAEHRVVLVRDAQGLSNKAREVAEAACQAPPPGLVLVLSATIPQGSKAKFYSNLQRSAVSLELGSVPLDDLPGWLVERAREGHGLEMEPEAARALAAAIGSQLGVLSSELDKLAAFVDDRARITLDDVRAVGGFVPRVDRWGWFDLVGERRIEEALRQLPALLESGETAVGLVIGIASHLLRVGLVVGGGREALERQLKPYQRWLASKIEPQGRRWTLSEVDDALGELLRTDRLMKTTALTDRQAMEELLLRLADRLDRRRSAA